MLLLLHLYLEPDTGVELGRTGSKQCITVRCPGVVLLLQPDLVQAECKQCSTSTVSQFNCH